MGLFDSNNRNEEVHAKAVAAKESSQNWQYQSPTSSAPVKPNGRGCIVDGLIATGISIPILGTAAYAYANNAPFQNFVNNVVQQGTQLLNGVIGR